MMAGSVPATVPTRLLVRRMASLLSTVAFCGAVLLAAAGGLAWQRAWAFLALTGLLLTLNLIVVVRTNPDVIVARAEKHRGTETFAKVFAVLYAPTFVGLLLVVRTALEDGMLTRRLSGYEAFTHQTRFRLLPGVW